MMYKVIVIGDSGVGKSSVLGRWIREDFHLNIPSTVHVELSAKSFKVEDKIIKVQFWDTAGQERFNAITRQFYRGSHGAVILYDITCRKSFEDVAKWLQDVREVNSDTVILMVGNKCDLVKQRTVKVTEAIDYSKEVGVAFLETSAFTGDNCIKAMQLILQDIHSRNSIPTSLSSHDKKPLLTPSKVLIIDDPEPQPQPQTLHLTASTPKTTNTRKKDDCAC
uniref:Uncharacterized protein n=1 Tax=Arcella intermedia TaxID=1963864 RepID=A0A6B2LH70_9EUKA